MIHPTIKESLGFGSDEPDKKVLIAVRKVKSRVCKPCWEIKYCPYGPYVEDFPLLPPTRKEAEKHNE